MHWTRFARAVRVCAAASAVALLVSGAARAQTTSHVAVLHADPALYDAEGWAARAGIARSFLATHADAYDFLVLFPAFPLDLSTQGDGETLGKHWDVRNEVGGIGVPLVDGGAQCGSARRLKGIIDVHSLVPGVDATGSDAALAVVAHEVAHQWSGRVRFRDPRTGSLSTALLGRDGLHWSYFLDSDASVLYGSDWRGSGAGTFVADASRTRYSALDLYLMGFLDASEVPAFSLLDPGPGAPADRTALPPPDGTSMAATAFPVDVSSIIAAVGPRIPDAAASQKVFRAAFVVIVPPGVAATADQLAFVDRVRREWANRFFFLTRGLGVMETNLVEPPPAALAANPSVQLGVGYLLGEQGPDGSWGSGGAETVRETQGALEALAPFRAGAASPPATALAAGAAYLAALQPRDVDTSARRELGLHAAVLGWNPAGPTFHDLTAANADGGVGLAFGYPSTVLDTALALVAARSASPEATAAATQFLLQAQHGDGGWSPTGGGSSDIETTALVLEYLATLPKTTTVHLAAYAGLEFLRPLVDRWTWGGGLRDDPTDERAIADAVLALDAWDRLGSEVTPIANALLAEQQADGSWYGSPYRTARSLRALNRLSLPNLVIVAGDVMLATSSATDGETVRVRTIVRNVGHVDGSQVAVQAFDESGRPFGPPVVIPSVPAGASVPLDLSLDTTGHSGSAQVFLVVDPDSLIWETRKDDNRAMARLTIAPRPLAPDLFVEAGSLAADPASITRVGTTVTVTARVGNVGRTDVQTSTVVLLAGTTPIATATLPFPAAGDQRVALAGTLPPGAGSATLRVVVDPENVVSEARKDNNAATLVLSVVPTVDLRVAQVSAVPNPVNQGSDVGIQFSVANGGTTHVFSAIASVYVLDATGAVIATLPSVPVSIPSGGSANGEVSWRANVSAAASVRVAVVHAADLDPSDNSALAPLSVNASGLPSLLVAMNGLSTAPAPLLEAEPGTVTAVVRNAGWTAAGPFSVDFWSGDPAEGGTRIARAPVAGLEASSEAVVSVPFTAPSARKLTLVAVVDPDNQVTEFDETDNRGVLTVDPTSRPDLVVESGDVEPQSAYPTAGDRVPVTIGVRNLGGQAAGPAALQLYQGAPESGGALIGSTVIPAVAGNGRASASFLWDTAGLAGAMKLVAVVNADRSTDESRFDNDRGERPVMIQSGPLALSEPYFSPNGDGVKDATELFYRLEAPAPAQATITDRRGRVVRTLTAFSSSVTGSMTWDGRDFAGALVRDGVYRLSVTAGDMAVAAIDAVVDTNRAPLLDVDRALHAPADLGASVRRALQPGPNDTVDSFPVGPTPDEQAVVVAFHRYRPGGWWYETLDCGLMRVPVDGSDPVRLTPPTWHRTQTCFANETALTPDGENVVWSNGGLHRLELKTQTVTILSTDASSVFVSPDGRTVFFSGDAGLEAVGIDGTNRRIVGPNTHDGLSSPSRGEVLFTISPPEPDYRADWDPGAELHVAARGSAGHRALVVGTPVPECLEFGPVVGEGELTCARADPRPFTPPPLAVVLPKGRRLGNFNWVSSSEIVYVVFSNAVDPGEEIFVQELATGVATRIYAADPLSPWASGWLGRPVADPAGDNLVFTATQPAMGSYAETWAISTDGGAPWKVFDWAALRPGTSVDAATFSGAGTFLYTDQLALAHLGNLSVQLSGYRRSSSEALTFRGTVADLNLDAWELTARLHGSSQPPIVVAHATSVVISGELATWAPPAPGTWEATLTAHDKAGNTRSTSAIVSFAEVPVIANLLLSPGFISPNGDGVQDTATVSYSVQEPISTQVVVQGPGGMPIRTIPVSHASTGTYPLTWDGRGDRGSVVADGAYRVTVGSQSKEVVVDATIPSVALTAGGTPDDMFAVMFFDYEVFPGYGVCPEPIPLTRHQEDINGEQQEKLMRLGLRTRFLAHDTHLLDWTFEAAASQPVTEYRAVFTGARDFDTEQGAELPLWMVGGDQVRLRARDLAGNVNATSPLAVPEMARLLAWGPGQNATMCKGYLELGRRPGWTPGVPTASKRLPIGLQAYRRQFREDGTEGGNGRVAHEFGFCFEPAFHGFWIENTIRQPIVAASMAWWTQETGWVVDQVNVAVTPWDIVTWDARATAIPWPRSAAFELRLLDASGRTFTAPVPACKGGGGAASADVGPLCPGVMPRLAGRDAFDLPVDASGSVADVNNFKIALRDRDTQALVPLALELVSETEPIIGASGEREIRRVSRAHVDLDALAGCRYDVNPEPNMSGRSPYWSFDACGLRAEHAEIRRDVAVLSLGARFRKPFSSVDLFLGSGANARFVTTLPGFQRVSAPVELSLHDLACNAATPITATVHFADGTTSTDTVLEKDACGDATLKKSCMNVHVTSSRGLTPVCAGQPADYQLTALASSEVSYVTTLALQATPPGGVAPDGLSSSPVAPGVGVSTGAIFGTSAFAEGTWMIDAVATDDTGATARSAPVGIVVNRTAPYLQLDAPAQGETVCPVLLPDGSRAVRVDGVVSDPALEQYSFLVRCGASGGPLLSVPRVAVAGALGAFRLPAQTPADCQLVLEARNSGGGSWCTPPVQFHVTNGAQVTASADAALFSPNDDGVKDVLSVHVGLVEPASVTLTATNAAGRSGLVWQGSLPSGTSVVPWNGTIDGMVPAEGHAAIRVDAVDRCGNPATARTGARVDTTSPRVRIDGPLAGTRVGAGALVTGEVGDDGGLDRYELSIGAGVAPTTFQLAATFENPTSGFLGAVPTRELPEGVYTVRLWARDLAGNEATTSVQIVVAPMQLINTFAVLPALVSPNGDGLLDAPVASFQLLGAADVTIDVLDAAGAVVMGVVPSAPTVAGQTDVPIAWTTLAALERDGSYQARLTASAAGIVETQTAPLDVDRAPPAVALRAPTSGSAVPGAGDVVGMIDDVHLDSWTLTLAGGARPATVLASGRSPIDGTLARLERLAEADYTLRLDARDRAGNVEHTEVTFASDTTPPTVAIVAPAEGAFVSALHGPITVDADVHDAHLAGVQLAVTPGGGAEQELYAGAALPPGGVAWSLTGVSDGPVDVELVATDAAGNSGAAHVAIMVDGTLPVVAISSPRDTYLGAGESIRGTASDANLATWTLEIASGPPTLTAMWFPLATASGSVQDDVLAGIASLPADGVYALRLTVVDRAGNTTQDTTAFVVDTTPPRPPPAVTAQEVSRDVLVTWQPSPDAEVVAYRVLRAVGNGAEEPLVAWTPALAVTDVAPLDGTYRYAVIAIDAAGLTSEPSQPATVTLDRVKPQAVIDLPAAGSAVSGIVRVTGTAWRATRLREYRVSVGAGPAPASFTLVRRSGMPVVQGELASVDFGAYPDRSEQTIRLEVEDLKGNVAEARVTVRVDATSPGAPVLVSATPGSSSVALAWQAPPDLDLAGFVLYRNGAIANAPSGAVPGSLSAYRLPASSLAYTDTSVPDGTYTYEVQAFDLAGNASPLSNALTVTLETQPPHAVITAPAPLARLTAPVDVVAEVPDEDVASVQFYARDGAGGTLRPLGEPVLRVPFTVRLDPGAYSGPVVELNAVATDRSGNVDPAPASLHVFAATRPSAPVVSARVTGDQVDLSWTDPDGPGSVAGYEIARDGSSLVPAPGRPAAVASSSDRASSPGQGYDGLAYTAWYSTAPRPTWQLDLSSPVVATELDLSLYARAEIEVSVNVRGAWIPVHRAVAVGTVAIPLGDGLEVQGCKVAYLASPTGISGLYEATLVPVALAQAGPLRDGPAAAGDHAYTVRAVTPLGLRSEATSAAARIYAPVLDAGPAAVATTPLTVTGSGATAGATVAILRGGVEVSSAPAALDGTFSSSVELVDGENLLVARATDPRGNVSQPSAPVTTTYDAAPSAVLALALTEVTGWDVALAFTASGDTSRVAGFRVTRTTGETSVVAASLAASERAVVDRRVPDGAHDYTVVAVNAHGLEGPRSNVVTAVVAVPALPAPTGLTVATLAIASALRLEWTFSGPPAAGFLVERGASASGPFTAANALALATGTTYVDGGLTPGIPVFYRVRALDPAGKASAPSNVASGTPSARAVAARPRILAPTRPGLAITTSMPTTPIDGLADPYAKVELYRNGTWLAAARAGALEFVPSRSIAWTQGNVGAASFDGATIAVDQGAGLAIQGRRASVTIASQEPSAYGAMAFSPDGTRLAFEATSALDGRRHVWVAAVADGAIRRVAQADGEERAPSWSPDGEHLAYLAVRPTSPTQAIGVVPAAGGPETLLSSAGRDVSAAVFGVGDAMLAIASSAGVPDVLVRLDLVTGASRELASSPDGIGDLAVAPQGQLAAFLVAGADPHAALVDVDSGSVSRMSTGGVPVQRLAFVADGTALAWFTGSGDLVVAPVGSSPTVVGNNGWGNVPDRVVPTRLGLYAFHGWGEVDLLDWGGHFAFDDVALVADGNEFAAVASDAAGRRSEASEPISVFLDASQLPDLSVAAAVMPDLPVAGAPATASVTVRNLGGARAVESTLDVRVIGDDGLVRVAAPVLVGELAPGASTVALVPIDLAGLTGTERLVATVDPEGRVTDPDRSNNTVDLTFRVAPTSAIAVSVTASPVAVPAGGVTVAQVAVSNPGLSKDATVRTRVADPAGATVVTAPEAVYSPLAGGGVTTLVRSLAVGAVLAGPYQVVAEVVSNGAVIAHASAPITVGPDRAAGLALSASRATYTGAQAIELDGTIQNRSMNAALAGATYAVQVANASGTVVFTAPVATIPQLWLGGHATMVTGLSPGTLAPGTYKATASAVVDGTMLATGSVTFSVLGQPALSGWLAVRGAGDPPVVPHGRNAVLAYHLANLGNADTSGLALRVVVMDPETLAIIATSDVVVGELAPSGTATGEVQLPTVSLALETYAVALVANHDGLTDVPIATGRFRVADSTPPLLAVQNLSDGMMVRGAVAPLVRAIDDHAGTALVRVAVDSQPPVPLALASGVALDGTWSGSVGLGADGVHMLVFSGVDAEGNDGLATLSPRNPVSLRITSDTTAPSLTISGVTEHACYGAPPVLSVQATDANAVATYAELDGARFVSGTPVATDGDHTLVAQATDAAGNQATSSVRFVVDGTGPRLAIAGVIDGSFVATSVAYRVTADDPHLTTLSASLNGAPAAQASTVAGDGSYALAVHAVDCAGNAADAGVTFTIDRVAPVVAISGVSEGSYVRGPVAPTWTATDLNLASVSATLNGAPASSGASTSSDGDYLLEVRATDRAGNSTTRSVAFVVDASGPSVEIVGFVDGSYVASPVYPSFLVRDANLASAEATLDAIPFAIGVGVAAEGLHLFEVTAVDLAGNRTVRSAHFTMDRTAPRIALSFPDGAILTGSVSPDFTVSDDNLASATAVLDGQPFTGGTPIVAEGAHVLTVRAEDLAGNTTSITGRFNIDDTPPRIVVSGVGDGEVTSGTPTPMVSIEDVHLATSTVTLDGAPFASGASVTAEGDHVLAAAGVDAAGLGASVTVRFAIDRTPPAIIISGVDGGGLYASGISATAQVSDAHLTTSSVRLDGAPYASGTPILDAGVHALTVTAADAAGNSSTRQVTFSVGDAAPEACPGPEPAQSRLPVFADWLLNCFEATAWGGVDLEHHTVVHDGTTSIALDPSDWAVVKLGRVGLRSRYRALEFWVHGGATGGQVVELEFDSGRDVALDTKIADLLGGPIPAGTWAKVTLPFKSATRADSLTLEFKAHGEGDTVHIDDLVLLADTTGSCAGGRGESCSDGDVCNGLERCDGAGACVRGVPLQTDDRNGCTLDWCDPAAGVSHTIAEAGRSCFVDGVCGAFGSCDGAGTCQLTATVQDVRVYDDELGACFTDYSDATRYDLYQTAIVEDGPRAISFDPVAGEQLTFFADALGASFDALEFWIHGGSAGGQSVTVEVWDEVGRVYRGDVADAVLGHPIAPGAWEKVQVPFMEASQPGYIAVAFSSDAPGATVFIDDVRLVRIGGAMPRGSCRSGEPPGTRLTVYEDRLLNCFEDGSWGGGARLASSDLAHGGERSIAFSPSGGSAVGLGRSALTSSYGGLELWVNGGTRGGQSIRLRVSSGPDVNVPQVELGSLLGGPIPAETWAKVTVPFRIPTRADDVHLMFFGGDAPEGTVYFDDIVLLAATAGTCTGASGASCSDGDVCTGAERCDGAGTCVKGLPPTVEDHNPCTIDWCDRASGVSHTQAEAGRSCLVDGVCNAFGACDGAGVCQATAVVADVRVYDDAVGACVADTSSTLEYDPYQTTLVREGPRAIRVLPAADMHVSFWIDDLATSFDALEFWIHGGPTGGQSITVGVYGSEVVYTGNVAADLLGHPIAPGVWEKVRVPFAAPSVPGFLWVSIGADEPGGALFLDDIRLVRNTP